jgi:hypothetical protein
MIQMTQFIFRREIDFSKKSIGFSHIDDSASPVGRLKKL